MVGAAAVPVRGALGRTRMRRNPRPLAAATLGTLLLAAHAVARPTVEDNLAELYGAAALDPTDVSTRLRLAGYLQSLGLAEEGAAILRELAASGADIDLLVDADSVDGCADCRGGALGGDLIVGDINGISNWGKFEASPGVWMYAFSAGTTNCNIGTERLEWFHQVNRHPVLGQNFYRIQDNVLRQIGQSWLKHLFFALSQQLCAPGCDSQNGTYLGVNCSDPYTSGRAGQQSNLGPRFQVRPSSGYFPYPPAGGTGVQNLLSRRLQVHLSDLNPAFWPSSIYFVVTKGVQWQDSQAENDNNNESWRRFVISYNNGGTPEDPSDDLVSNPTFSGSTQRMKTPVDAWQFYVPTVETVDAIVPNDSNFMLDGSLSSTYYSGRFHIGSYVEDNGDGTWTYSYAIFNQNSDRAAQSFRVPVLASVAVTDAGFSDVDYHSGDGVGGVTQDGTDWSFARDDHAVTWSTQAFDENPNANALRWATTYTFWFTADAPPDTVHATLGLFRPGIDPDPVVASQGPACLLAWDLDDDGYVGFADLNIVLSGFGAGYDFADLNSLLAVFGQQCE